MQKRRNAMPERGLSRIRASTWVMFAALAVFAFMPAITAYMGEPFYLDVSTRLVILSIAAVSLNLILGYGGMISFGHAAFIGIGAYAVGIPFYYDVTNGYLQFGLAIGVSALYGLVTGAVCLRTRGVYFIMITLAFAQMVYYAIVSLEEYGADDGLSIYERSRFAGLFSIESRENLYYLCFASLLVVLFIVHRIVHSRFGMAIRGAKGNEERMRAIGFNTYAYRLTCYVISGAICGYAGALLANFTDFISPEMNNWARSGEFMFMVILGGAGTLFGPVLGAAAFIWLEVFLGQWTTHWRLIFGILLILTVLFARGGINGFIDQVQAALKASLGRRGGAPDDREEERDG